MNAAAVVYLNINVADDNDENIYTTLCNIYLFYINLTTSIILKIPDKYNIHHIQ